MRGHAVGGGESVIGKVLGRFDVVLIVVGPIKINFLTVVGNGITLSLGVATLGDKVTILIVAAEKGIKVVVNGGFEGVPPTRACRFCLCVKILFTEWRTMISRGQISLGVDGISTHSLFDLCGNLFQCLDCPRLFGKRV